MKLLNKDILKSSSFRYSLLIISIVFITITIAFISSTSNNVLCDILEKKQHILNTFANQVENTFESIESTALHIASIPSISELSMNSSPHNIDKYISLSRSLRFLSNNTLYESIYFYFNNNDIVFSSESGLYPLAEFYDKNFLSFVPNLATYDIWVPSRFINRDFFTDYPLEVLSYIKKIPLSTPNAQDFMCINLYKHSTEQLFIDMKPTSLDNVTITLSGTSLLSYNLHSIEQGIPVTHTTSNHELFLTTLVSRHEIGSTIYENLRGLIPLICSSPVLIFCIAYCYSYLIGKPLKDFISKLKELLPDSIIPDTSNELEQLDAVFTSLLHTNKSITTLMQENLPLLQEKIILHTICHHSTTENLINSYTRYNINFSNPYYVVILVHFPEIQTIFNLEIRDEVRLLIMESTKNNFISLGSIYGAHLDEENIVFLLNTSHNYENGTLTSSLEKKCTEIYHSIKNELSLHLIFSIGLCSPDNPLPHKTYLGTKANLTFTSSFDNEYILFTTQDELKTCIDYSFIKLLVDAIISKDIPKLEHIIETLYFLSEEDSLDILDAKKIFINIICSTYSKLIACALEISPEQLLEGIIQINTLSSPSQYRPTLFNSLKCLLSNPKLKEDVIDNSYVSSAINYIENNYYKDISIPDIAESIRLNHIYLNRLFKLSTGKTLSEYLNFYRIELSKKLLQDHSLKIIDISESVGYNDVRSYIRFFKKFTDTTPTQYRKDV